MAWPAATASTRMGVVVFSGSRCTPSSPISPRLHTTLRMPVSIGSSMPCRLRNDQYWTSRMIRSAAPKKIGIFMNCRSAASPMIGDAAEIDVHVGVALARPRCGAAPR